MVELLEPGDVVGETWVIEGLLGRGGMGEVWRARHLRVDGKYAAVKVLHSTGGETDDFAARFKREAEIAARVEHPNIVQIFDYATLPSGEPYLVMELLRGESLKERLRRGPLTLEELRPLAAQLCSALHVAHAAGVVHRDLKPDNLFLVPTPTGPQLKVLDFGISKILGSNTVQTAAEVLLGTPLYMSPEQANGDNAALTPRSDVFSMASICYEALAGTAPFAADSVVKIMYRIVGAEPPDIPSLEPSAMAALRRALAKSPDARTPDVATFAAELCGVSLAADGLPAASVEGVVPPVADRRDVTAPTANLRQPLATPASQDQPTRQSGKRAVPGAAAPAPEGPLPSEAPPVTPPSAQVRRSSAALPWLVGGSLVAVATLGAALWHRGGAPDEPRPRDAAVARTAAPSADVPREPSPALASPADADLALDGADPGPRKPASADAPRRPRTEPSLDPLQQALLDEAEAAFTAERFAEALAIAQKPGLATNARASALRTMSACALGNLGLAVSTRPRVAASELPAVRSFCRARAIELP